MQTAQETPIRPQWQHSWQKNQTPIGKVLEKCDELSQGFERHQPNGDSG